MPNTIKFSDNPNEETAFVTTEDDTRTRVVLTTPVDGTVKFPDNPNSTKVSVTVDGVARKAVAVYNLGGGGGGDQHNLGWYATESALTTAHPTAEDGDWAIVGATDTVWVWDSDTTAWKDTGQAGIELPSQTGNAGKFLTTDGTAASWSDKPLVNEATGTYSLTILGTPTTATNATNICEGSSATGNSSLSVGRNSSTSGASSMAFGTGATASGNRAIQFGAGVNSDANTFKIANANGNYEMMSADGTIPTARLTKVNTTITLAAADWSSNTQTVSVTGVSSTSVVFVAPAPADTTDYVSAGILCTSQATNSLTFTATTTPTTDIDVNIVCL